MKTADNYLESKGIDVAQIVSYCVPGGVESEIEMDVTALMQEYATIQIDELKICTGCGRLSTDPPVKLPALACCPDNHYLPIRKYWERSSFPSYRYQPHKKEGGQG